MDYKARFYSPSLGRFIQPDTIIPSAATPQSWNRFSYVQNNPVHFNDPTGHKTRHPGDGRDFDDCWIKTKDGQYIRNVMCQVYVFEEEKPVKLTSVVKKLLSGITAMQGQPGINILMANASEEDEDENNGNTNSSINGTPPICPGCKSKDPILLRSKGRIAGKQHIDPEYLGDDGLSLSCLTCSKDKLRPGNPYWKTNVNDLKRVAAENGLNPDLAVAYTPQHGGQGHYSAFLDAFESSGIMKQGVGEKIETFFRSIIDILIP